MFDETQFPFEKLHPNAGALLKKEILLLPSHLLGDECVGVTNDDSIMTNSSMVPHELPATGTKSAENGEANGTIFVGERSNFKKNSYAHARSW